MTSEVETTKSEYVQNSTQEVKTSPLALLAATCSKIGPTSTESTAPTMSNTPNNTPVKSVPIAAPQVLSLPVGIPQQLLQQQGTQILSTANGQNIAYNVMQPMQTVTVDGQEALFIPAMSLAAATGNQQHQQLFSPGQILRSPGVMPTNLQNIQTVQLANGQSVQVRPANMPQVVQFPMQQTIPVQVPISTANGQTIYQTIHFPVQLAAMPNIIQAQQIVPQMANIITPTGQIQQVQITNATVAPQNSQQTPTSVANQAITVQADATSQPLTFTGANGQQFTIIPANLQQVRSTNIGNIIQVPNIQTIPTIQNIPVFPSLNILPFQSHSNVKEKTRCDQKAEEIE